MQHNDLRNMSAGIRRLAAAAVALNAIFAATSLFAQSTDLQDRSFGLKVSAQILQATDKQPARLSIAADIPSGWHIYSITQKPGGPKPTVVKVAESKQYRLSGPLSPTPIPTVEREKYKDIWPDLEVEEHAGHVAWVAPLEVGNGVDVSTLAIEGEINAFMCSEKCVDVKLPFVARVSGTMASAPQSSQATAKLTFNAGGNAEPATPSPAKAVAASAPAVLRPTIPSYSKQNLKLTGNLDREVLAPGESATLTLTFEPKVGWHIYTLAHRVPKIGAGSMPTLVAITDGSGLTTGQPAAKPSATVKHSADGKSASYYRGNVPIEVRVHVPKSTAPGKYEISGAAGFQTCSDLRCLEPTGVRFVLPVTVADVGKPGVTPVLFAPSSYEAASGALTGKAGDAIAAEQAAAPATSQTDYTVVSVSGGESNSLLFNLMLAFVGGLILNAMPCVLPVIGLKVMSFVQQAGESPRRVFMLNVWFAAGVIAVFLTLAALVSFTSFQWSEQFGQPAFRIVMAAILFVFALSLFGVWEIPIPGFVGSNTAYAVAEREGASGAFFKGVLSTVLATPCIGPLMVGALAFVLQNREAPHVAFLILGTMGLGMSAPYLLIGAKPSLLRWIPKPGSWMETFKQSMGFMLMASVIWLFWVMDAHYVVPAMVLLLGLAIACWWVGRTPLTAELRQKLTTWAVAAVIAVLIGSASFKWLLVEPAASPAPTVAGNIKATDDRVWRPFSAELFHELRAQKVPVLVDFTAKWCLVCQTNKGISLHTAATEKYMREHGIVGLIADKTNPSPDVDSLMVQLKHNPGLLPFYAVFPAAGGPVLTHNQGPLPQGTLLDMLQRAVPPAEHATAATAMKTTARPN